MNQELEILKHTTTEEVFERFLRVSVADGVASPRTLRIYRDGFAAFLTWCAAVIVDPRMASFDDIENYRAYLIAAGLKRPTIKLRLVAVRALYTALQRWGVRPDNPAAGVKTPRDKEAAVHVVMRKALTAEETKRLLAVLPGSWAPQDVRDATIVRLMLFHGLRAGEVAALRADALDYQSFSALDIRGKGDKPRTVVLCPETRKDLIAWTTAVKHPQTITGPSHWGDGKIVINADLTVKTAQFPAPLFFGFDTSGMRPLSVRAIERIVDRYLKAAGLKRAGRSAHALRHTYGVLATLGGAKREAVGESMGHSSLDTTDIYIRAAAAFQENPADAVQRMLGAK